MKKNRHRLLSLLLAVTLIFGINPAVLYAQNPVSSVHTDTGQETKDPSLKTGEISSELSEFANELSQMKNEDTEKNFIPVEQQTTGQEKLLEFQTCRLILKSDHLKTDHQALTTAGPFHHIYILQYEDAAKTAEAYEYYKSCSWIEFVQADKVHSSDHLMETSGFEKAKTQNAGVSLCGFSSLQEKILEKYGKEDDVPQVTVAVLDTGVDFDHEAVEGRLAGNGFHAAWSSGFFGGIWDRIKKKDRLPEDDYGHGTAVASVITMSTPDYVKILPIKVSTLSMVDGELEPNLDDSDIYLGVEYAIEQGADVVNMSFGGYELEKITRQYLDDCNKAGVIVVSAYGNDAIETNEIYPACYSGVVGVSSVNNDLTFASKYSNYGNSVDISAPGTNVYVAKMGGGYNSLSGTSFATPYVSAAMALAKAYLQTGNTRNISNYILKNTCDLGAAGWDKKFGYGLLDLTKCPGIDELGEDWTQSDETNENRNQNGNDSERDLSSSDSTVPIKESDSIPSARKNLPTPQITGLKNQKKGIHLKWSRTDGSQKYRIYRKKSGGKWKLLSTVGNQTAYTDTSVKNGIMYGYKIQAVGKNSESAFGTMQKWMWLKPSAVSASKLHRVYIRTTCKKMSKITGYQISYSKKSDFSKAVKKKKTKKRLAVLGKLSKGTYYIRVRTYKKVNNQTYYSAWSAKKKVKIST